MSFKSGLWSSLAQGGPYYKAKGVATLTAIRPVAKNRMNEDKRGANECLRKEIGKGNGKGMGTYSLGGGEPRRRASRGSERRG